MRCSPVPGCVYRSTCTLISPTVPSSVEPAEGEGVSGGGSGCCLRLGSCARSLWGGTVWSFCQDRWLELAKSREQDCSGSEVESSDACFSYYNGMSRINHYMDTYISIYIEEGESSLKQTFFWTSNVLYLKVSPSGVVCDKDHALVVHCADKALTVWLLDGNKKATVKGF